MLVLSPDVSPHPCGTNNFVTNMRFPHTHTHTHTCSLLRLDGERRTDASKNHLDVAESGDKVEEVRSFQTLGVSQSKQLVALIQIIIT